ncbi:hypothetical protein F2Q69_00011570 [Brassica cretica]|uniref:Uncharacterized protein n=1 Tax=Brassica cretica TaxID=69181 RepID=A0A8S9QX35_BRACR|nr:hypothetical protein F2Q69_00011570 [Brassica cretica]
MPSSTRSNKDKHLLFSEDPAHLERSIRKDQRSTSIDATAHVDRFLHPTVDRHPTFIVDRSASFDIDRHYTSYIDRSSVVKHGCYCYYQT